MYMKKITYEIANERFLEQGRTDLELCQNGWNGWKKKSKFYDKIEQDFFWAAPYVVFKLCSVHPNRRIDKFKNTMQKKYGENITCSMDLPYVREKIKKTCLEKYGVENTLLSKEIRNKQKQTCLKIYGAENPFKNKKIQNKIQKAVKNKYGVDNVSQNETIKTKKKNTCLKRYGKENVSQINVVKEKKGNKKIIDLNIFLKDWLKQQQGKKPSAGNFAKYFIGKSEITSKEASDALIRYRQSKTSLEMLGEQLFEVSHYNKKPKRIKQLYKPDFKLSDTVYVNVDGLYWHSERNQENKYYHFNMRKHFEEYGLCIIQFHENEIRDKPEICKSIIMNVVGRAPNKIYSNKCEIKIVTNEEAEMFLKQNHLLDPIKTRHVGLYYENELVSLLSYKEKKHTCKIERFCSLIEHDVVGGFSKMLKHLEQNYLKPTTTEIHNWVDLRYNTGNCLLSNNFKQKTEDRLDWKWTDCKNTFHKKNIKNLSQQEDIGDLNLFKIYDAGQRLYVKKLKPSS